MFERYRSKYPLVMLNRLIELFGKNIMVGYDIDCQFSITAGRNAKVGPKMKEENLNLCVNAFHGYAHRRLCQLSWHPSYLNGVGLEDFETCERVFSDSNRVAGRTRHASKFHRRQSMLNMINRWNEDTYGELGMFTF